MSIPILLYFVCDFDFYGCFITAFEQNDNFLQILAGGAKTWKFNLYSVWGNYLAFLIGVGFPLFGLLIAFLISKRHLFVSFDLADKIGFALSGLIVLSGCAGLFYMETERIWLFMAVFVVVPATQHIKTMLNSKAWLVVPCLLLFQTLVQEVLLFSLW